jgi:cytosine/adenosine deaminase-related metal-dependent hydrolase
MPRIVGRVSQWNKPQNAWAGDGVAARVMKSDVLMSAKTMILRASVVLPMVGPPIDSGAVAVAGNLIAAVGPFADIVRSHAGDVTDLGDAVLLPGLINSHCHLDYTGFAGQVPWRGDFVDWLVRIAALKKQWSTADYLVSIRQGLGALGRSGTTSVVNIECFPSLADELGTVPLRVWWCPELIDLSWSDASVRMSADVQRWVTAHPPGGVSPHAPYTVSDGLYRLVSRWARDRGWLLTTHAAESREEDEMWRRSRGPMFERFGRGGCGGAVRHLSDLDVLGPNCLLAHVNYLSDNEAMLTARSGSSVAHCPRTHRFFERDPAPWDTWRRHGINVCLGTDSVASNHGLDMRAEMRELIRSGPGMSADDVLRMATVHGARALGLDGKLGCLKAGARADLIGVKRDGQKADPYEVVVYSETSIMFSMIDGKERIYEPM